MDIRVSGHQVDTGDALRQRVEERLSTMAEKYLAKPVSSQTTFGKGPHDHNFLCDIIVHVRSGAILKGGGRAADARSAFEEAAEKIEKQMRRYMRRLKDHHGPGSGEASAEIENDAAYTVFAPGSDEEEPADNPPIVAETRVDIPVASVSDAVMQLDLRNTNALMFRNSGTGKFNMVYRRGDGTIGWVEPQRD